jgi:hypothetical protein
MILRSKHLIVLLMCLFLALSVSCTSREEYAGTYKAEGAVSPEKAEVTIELKESGEGVWRTGDEEITFVWYVKGRELRFNTKEGGVIVGKPKNGSFETVLPGKKKMSFKKIQ